MPRAELPSGAWVEYRDKLLAADRFAVQAVAKVEIGDSLNRASYLEMQNDMRNMLLSRIITKWSFPSPVPSQDSFRAPDMVIGEAMDLDDYAALEKEVEPLMEKIAGRGTPSRKSSEETDAEVPAPAKRASRALYPGLSRRIPRADVSLLLVRGSVQLVPGAGGQAHP